MRLNRPRSKYLATYFNFTSRKTIVIFIAAPVILLQYNIMEAP